MKESKGLYGKYSVYDTQGNQVEECFVLRPDRDPDALEALKTYAYATTNSQLNADLLDWIEALERESA